MIIISNIFKLMSLKIPMHDQFLIIIKKDNLFLCENCHRIQITIFILFFCDYFTIFIQMGNTFNCPVFYRQYDKGVVQSRNTMQYFFVFVLKLDLDLVFDHNNYQLINIITVQVHIQTMLISLPPGTSSFAPIGTMTIKLAPIFFNSIIKNPKYSVKLWGVDHNIPFQQISTPSMDVNKISTNTIQYNHQIKFGITTNLTKLTGYFRDMAILIINVCDSRSGKQIAICYVKMRRFIINDLMSEFEQNFQVLSLENQFKNNSFGNTNKKVLGEIKIKLELDVPLSVGSVQKPTNQLNNISITNHIKSKKVEIQNKQYTRNIITEPYIFQNMYQTDKPINKYRNKQRNKQISEEQSQLERGISKSGDYHEAKELLLALQTKPKMMAVNILDNLSEDSLNNQQKYPNISELHRKYGPNNVCIQRMRLKLDQAKYLNPQKQLNSISMNKYDSSDQNCNGYICKIKNFQTIIGNNKDLKDFQVSIFNSEKDLTIIAQSLMKQVGVGGIYIKNILTGNVVQLQNKGYKSKGIIKNSNVQGEPLKMYIKRKDSNKKVAQFDFFIERLQQQVRIDLSPKKNIKEPTVPKEVLIKTKSHFYISARPYNQSPYKSQQYVFSIHPESQKQPVQGKKMIFTAQNNLQNVKVKVQGSPPNSHRNGLSQNEIMIKINPQIKMKEEILLIGGEKFRIFMASADTVQNLMKIVVLYDSNPVNQNKQIQNNNPNNQGAQLPLISHQKREQKLKQLFKCFHSLMMTTNSSCMQIINKLLSPSTASVEQLGLFELMCKSADIPIPDSQMMTHDVFAELLHGQFSMFWSCFQQYRKWNGVYSHALRNAVKNLEISIGVSKKDPNKLKRKQRRVISGSLQKLYRDKQQLFGLISVDKCQKILLDSFKNILGHSQIKKLTEQQQNLSDVENKQTIQRLQKITLNLRNLLVLLCRYTGGQSMNSQMNMISVHCVKIAQLQSFLMDYQDNNDLFINQHQILAICEQKNQEKAANNVQLLFEVVQSCISSEHQLEGSQKSRRICDRLGQLLEQTWKIETEESSEIEDDYGRIQTDNNTYIHMNTQQPERLQTQQINNTYINIGKNKKQQSNAQESINIHLKELIIANQLITVPELSNSIIQVVSDKKIIKVIKYHELPKTIQVQNMKDYKIILTIYNEQKEQIIRQGNNYIRLNQGTNLKQQWKFQGLFIANQKIERILLYSGDKEGMKQIGYIRALKKEQKKENQQYKQQQNSELMIEIQKKTEVPFKTSFKKLKEQQYQKYHKEKSENQQNQLIKIMKQQDNNQKSLKEQKIISYKILSIWPPPHSNQTYKIMIEGAEKIIQYPEQYCLGRLQNKDPQKEQLQIEIQPQIKNSMGDLKYKNKINKVTGSQQIIMENNDGTLNCIVTIQLNQYIGDLIQEQQNNSNLQNVIYLNIYHLQSYGLLKEQSSLKEHSQLAIIITNQSDTQPIFFKDINIKRRNQQSPFNQGSQPYSNKQQWIRHQWIGESAKIKKSKVYNIHIYKKPLQRTKSVQNAENLLAHFQFTIKYHPQNIGIFQNKGYLIDQNKIGYRLAIDVFQINYNDVFSKNSIGRQKFQSLLTVFQVENIMKINKGGVMDTQKIKGVLRSLFGFNNMQIHLFFQLQRKQNQIQKIITQWDVDSLLKNQSINLSSYSILDIFSEFQIYDFFNSGLIPKEKAELINVLIFDLNKINHVTQKQGFLHLDLFQIQHQQGWVRDLKFDKKDGNIDYLLILWTLRQFAIVDNFFINGELKSTQKNHKEKTQNDITSKNFQNSTNIDHLQNQSISKIKTIQIELLSFKNLRINDSPATLTFYINGEKVAQPIPRCFTYQYQNPKTIITNFPIILEVYNKKYGVKSLYEEQLIETVKIYQQKINILGGQMIFLIDSDKQEYISKKNKGTLNIPTISGLNKSIDDLSNLNTNLNKTNLTNNQFRQSRKQKWENLKNRDQNTKKIADILKNRISSRQSR